MILGVSVVVGLVLAVLYEFAWFRTQTLVLARWRKLAPLLSVAGFFVRLIVLGLVFWALWAWTPLNLLATAIAFAAGFTVLSVFFLYRFTKGRHTSGTSTQVLP